ncbi:2-phosphoglycerate kinase [Clostridium intestinale]|uniref:2-phosphoglycerate kinase n=1 Tax=Clostridium intestinale URNW TaxID=1294142 RepID=U2PWN4_9CLOT|nr:2-phosphoglycerate kinase [Clostridium intestinale]ERK30875.1 2-phosphoglycerate kinase [Clostridium intestinale URNW]
MVILIGGVSCTGKTVMAQKLLEKYKIPYLSIDHIKMGLIRGSKYCDFSATDGDNELTYKLWPIIKGIIMTNIENGQHIIIEGCYLPPEYISDFEPHYLKQIIALYIGFSKDYLEKYFNLGIIDHRSEIEKKEYDDYYMNKDNFIKLHSKVKKLCNENNANFFEINENYIEEISNVYKWIDEQIEAYSLFIT